MRQIRIYDSSFTGKSASTPDAIPKHFEWVRKAPSTNPTFYTDSHIREIDFLWSHRIAWLLEPSPLHPENYKFLHKYNDYFSHILTYDKEFMSKVPQSTFYSFGGSWIPEKKWSVYPKSEGVSIIASTKNSLPGHELRQEAIKRFSNFFGGIYGKGRNEIPEKLEGLRRFRYSVVIESCRLDYYFTEKLIDCFATGTIPIYWGCPSIHSFFNQMGVISFRDLDELETILMSISKQDYESRLAAIYSNLIKAREYRVVEDWIYKNCRGLFT